ncbi:MAG: pilus assembly protein [Chloroflexi bacterium]|nr:MAG: pilus assembly protein [Chloroflexota bacterium]MBL1194372.1 pilus assembly protein [Chloroflexota bacterium]NOH11660.1 pilus assembly protein [Chloroflexota bacterium]
MKKSTGAWRKKERGQSLVELSIGFVAMMTLLAGILDFGRVYYTFLALQNAAQEGASYVCAFPSCLNSTDCADPNNGTYRAQNESETGLIDWSSSTVAFSPTEPVQGDILTMSLTHKHQLMAPFISALAPNGFLITGTASCRVIGTP